MILKNTNSHFGQSKNQDKMLSGSITIHFFAKIGPHFVQIKEQKSFSFVFKRDSFQWICDVIVRNDSRKEIWSLRRFLEFKNPSQNLIWLLFLGKNFSTVLNGVKWYSVIRKSPSTVWENRSWIEKMHKHCDNFFLRSDENSKKLIFSVEIQKSYWAS